MQPDNTAEKKTDTSTGFPTSTDQYLAYLYAHKEQIDLISQLINSTPQLELINDHEKVRNLVLQIADVINDLEALSGNPLGKKFNKRSVLKHLNNARVELNKASLLAGATDTLTQILCFEHIVKCRDYLNLAKDLMPLRGG